MKTHFLLIACFIFSISVFSMHGNSKVRKLSTVLLFPIDPEQYGEEIRSLDGSNVLLDNHDGSVDINLNWFKKSGKLKLLNNMKSKYISKGNMKISTKYVKLKISKYNYKDQNTIISLLPELVAVKSLNNRKKIINITHHDENVIQQLQKKIDKKYFFTSKNIFRIKKSWVISRYAYLHIAFPKKSNNSKGQQKKHENVSHLVTETIY